MEEKVLYNILWIDDEYEGLNAFKGLAKRKGINLIPFKSLNRGMDELERNYLDFDGILLDAKFFENEDDVSGSEDTDNVHRANERILKINKKFEIFILTGQAEAFNDKTFHKAFKNVYKKGDPNDNERLFSDIIDAAKELVDTQIRNLHKRVFDVCTEQYIGAQVKIEILELLKVDAFSSIGNNFNAVRKVVEALFCAFNKFKLLPDEFVKPTVSINESNKFLTGKDYNSHPFQEKNYQHFEETHLPKQISSYLKNILNITQNGSHRSEIDSFVNTIKTPYLFTSTLFQLLDVIVWFKMYIDSKPKTENWEKIQSASEVNCLIYGKVINVNNKGGYAFLKPSKPGENIYIPHHLVSEYALKDGVSIQVEVEEYTDKKSDKLQKRVKKVIKT